MKIASVNKRDLHVLSEEKPSNNVDTQFELPQGNTSENQIFRHIGYQLFYFLLELFVLSKASRCKSGAFQKPVLNMK